MKLTLSWWRPLSYKNQSIDLQSKSMDGFYMITDSVIKELNTLKYGQMDQQVSSKISM